MEYQPAEDRYEQMKYRRCGQTGLLLPEISLGLWHNFGHVDNFENCRAMLQYAFDKGITHFDLANNYGPPPGSAEENFGSLMKLDFLPFRDELIISSKAGYHMWKGPYGEWGSRKNLLASLDQSLKRMGLEYVDIFYSHRFDPNTPLEETMLALDHAVRQGKALYVGVSNYNAERTQKAYDILRELKTPFIINQSKYSMFVREPENGLLSKLKEVGLGMIAFSPLAQGSLTDRYLNGIPKDSRAGGDSPFLNEDQLKIDKVRALNDIATSRSQSMAQMAIAWLLRTDEVTSVLIGASSVSQLENNLESLNNTAFSNDELERIEKILND